MSSREQVEDLFEKIYTYNKKDDDGWELPSAENCCKEWYQLKEFQRLAAQLNEVKCRLNGYNADEWRKHTKSMEPTGHVIPQLRERSNAELLTVAWTKFYECLHRFKLVDGHEEQLNTLHLCEAPGAFIAALNHYLRTQPNKEKVNWSWLATTLNPYYEGNSSGEMIVDDRLILQTFDKWCFYDDFSGNIISMAHIESLKQRCAASFADGKVKLVTADGSINCSDNPGCQETVVARLHLAELIAALDILAEGGNFLIKKFTLFEAFTIGEMYLLNCAFESVSVYKPATSKRGNSEVYVICRNYQATRTKNLNAVLELLKTIIVENKYCVMPIFAKRDLPVNFLRQHEVCCRLFKNLQCRAITDNIQAYKKGNGKREMEKRQAIKRQVCRTFFEQYRVRTLKPEDVMLANNIPLLLSGRCAAQHSGSYSERRKVEMQDSQTVAFNIQRELNSLERTFYVNTFKYKCQEMPLVRQCIYRGAPFSKLLSSHFTQTDILTVRTKLEKLLGVDIIMSAAFKCNITTETTIVFDTACGDYCAAQQQFFVQLLRAIGESETSIESIEFVNFPFLTHYAVSMLRYLAQCCYFNELEIKAHPFQVTLRGATLTTAEQRNLLELADLLAKEHCILCITDLMVLHRNALFYALREYNDRLLVHYCNEALQQPNDFTHNSKETAD